MIYRLLFLVAMANSAWLLIVTLGSNSASDSDCLFDVALGSVCTVALMFGSATWRRWWYA